MILELLDTPCGTGWQPAADHETHRQALIAERMQKMPELDAAIRTALEIKPYLVEVVPVK